MFGGGGMGDMFSGNQAKAMVRRLLYKTSIIPKLFINLISLFIYFL